LKNFAKSRGKATTKKINEDPPALEDLIDFGLSIESARTSEETAATNEKAAATNEKAAATNEKAAATENIQYTDEQLRDVKKQIFIPEKVKGVAIN